jgi:serine/threonine protein kinase
MESHMPIRNDPDPDIEVVERGGSGLYAVVWRGRQQILNRDVAIKLIRPDRAQWIELQEHAQGMARAGGHPNIVTVHAVTSLAHPETDELVDALILEWLDGVRLSDWLKAGGISREVAHDVAIGVIKGIQHIHSKGLTHGDLHAENVMLVDDVPKIIDIDYDSDKSLVLLTTLSRDERIRSDLRNVSLMLREILAATDLPAPVVSEAVELLRSATETEQLMSAVNGAFSSNKELPLLTYVQVSNATDQALEQAINSVLRDNTSPSVMTRAMESISDRIQAKNPNRTEDSEWKQQFEDAISECSEIVRDFARLSSTVAESGSAKASRALYKNFGSLIVRYTAPTGINGYFFRSDFDLHRFVVHELFLIYVSQLMLAEQWEIIGDILRREIYVPNQQPNWEIRSFGAIREPLELFNNRHSILLRQHFENSVRLADVSIDDLEGADVFLSLPSKNTWWPVLLGRSERIPRFLVECRSSEHLDMVLRAADLDSKEHLVTRLHEICHMVSRDNYPSGFHLLTVKTEGLGVSR